ncbi:MAG TPA: Clp protease N-terminal domain-containing protein [Streptosporangiaceae bacterium]
MFRHFDSEARQALTQANHDAYWMRHKHIGPEHLLLGMAVQETGLAGGVLAALGLKVADLRERVVAEGGSPDGTFGPEAPARRGSDVNAGTGMPGRMPQRSPFRIGGDVPFNASAKRSVKLASRAAAAFKSSGVSTGHLLLGVLDADGDNATLRILSDADVDVSVLREELARRLRSAA